MHDKPTHKFTEDNPQRGLHPLKVMSAEQFAALGLESVVFSRTVDTGTLARLVPEARIEDETGEFILVMSADGRPVLVTDSAESLEGWLEEQPVVMALVH